MLDNQRGRSIGIKTKIVGLLSFVLLLFLIIYIIWVYQDQRAKTESELVEQSEMLITEMNAFWKFISYNQDSINYTSDGVYDYKGLHCAIAGKSVAKFFSQDSDYEISFTKFEPRNIYNTPDEYETEALHFLEQEYPARTSYYSFTDYEGVPSFRYVSAMEVTQDCLDCHGIPAYEGEEDVTGYQKEGWKLKDMGGAVSVVVPTDTYFGNMRESIMSSIAFFIGILLLMAIAIYFALTRLITRPLDDLRASLGEMEEKSSAQLGVHHPAYSSREMDDLFDQFNSMSSTLSSLYENLESQVNDRTSQLSAANEELERQREHIEEVNNKLKQENRYKSDFLAIVSHELKTPLTSILAFSELMEQSVDSQDEKVQKQLEEIEKNSQILLEMVDNILATARIQTGSEKLNLELVDLNDIVGMVEATSESLALKKNITFETKVNTDVPLIISDWEKVRRIVLNLVSNAIKFTPIEGKVTVDVDYDQQEQSVLIKVADTGIGIPEDKQELIFERFTQENMSTVRRYGGSGLGLSLVKELASMLGGLVSVQSELGEGSVFTVILPVHESEGELE